MKLGPDYEFQCPQCHQKVLQVNVQSSNTIGAVHYSDGTCRGPMTWQTTPLTRCPGCSYIFWLLEENRTGNSYEIGSNETIPRAEEPSFNDLCEAIEKGVAQTEATLCYLREKAWQEGNRYNIAEKEFPSEHLKQKWIDNAIHLLKLLPEKSAEEKMIKAEVYRNIGEFDKCRRFLKSIHDKNLKHPIDLMLKACDDKNTFRLVLKSSKLFS